ncbi:murein transglycosylase A [Tepidicaulis sp. LMO-SS28]|uniref:murein transglycosylase A n=1 Tax=Tepidicaulis sp. LMO-SS28 TaxID=3447455 RepID=UPI003EDF7503
MRTRWKAAARVKIWGALLTGAALLLAACAEREEDKAEKDMPAADLTLVSFESLPGWAADDHEAALAAFRRSCSLIARRAGDAQLDPHMTAKTGLSGAPAAWAKACAAAEDVAPGGARAFFEARFAPYALKAEGKETGLFTGYFEPDYKASRVRGGPYQTPLLSPPADLMGLDLGRFDPELQGKRIYGRVEGQSFVPYPDRAEIENGQAGPGAKPVAFLADPVDAFFLHIQGSGRLELEDGSTMRVGFAGKNGRPYTPIGRVLAERGFIPREKVSMQSIRAWLKENPEKRGEILAENRSYIFFKEIEGSDPALGPIGAGGLQLTPGRSLAVDRAYHGLGALVFLSTSMPDGASFQRLMVAQDTGSAIKGPIRGDIFVGSGKAAGEIAGELAAKGRLYVLLPAGARPES